MRKRLLITGTPKSGTRYIADLFRQVGLDIGHERVRADGSASCFLAVDDYYYPNTGHNRVRARFGYEQTWHQVREPLTCISALVAGIGSVEQPFWRWQEKHTGIEGNMEPALKKCALFWVAWNGMVKPDWRYRVEDIRVIWPEMLDRLGMDAVKMGEVSDRHASVRPAIPRYTWDGIRAVGMYDAVKVAAKEYGYE